MFFLLPVLQEAQRRIPAPPLTARFEHPKPPAPVPPQAEPPAPAPVRQAPVAKAPQKPAPAPPILSIEPVKQAPEPAFVVPAQPASAAAAAAPGANASGQPGAAAAASGAGGLDPGAVGRYRLELMDLARRYKRYPRIAQDNNWEGRVELRLAIGGDGSISSFTVRKSAGRTVLDDEAQAMLRSAHAKLALPPALRGTAFQMDIAVDFSLKEDQK